MKNNKESYTKDETIEIGPGKRSNIDKTTLNSDIYYFFGRYYKSMFFSEEPNTDYENIKDWNICYNAKKFNEFKNLIDCGYAEIKVNYGGKDYELISCYLIPTANIPELFKEPYSSFQKGFLNDIILNTIIATNKKEIAN